ncbi:MAG: ribulose-5-phosphate 4-epimerase-like epimerase or aldolase [Brevibacillus sp.]|jgi:ribulose-5-phosphate 4-epimerase/fuculose-1-phosphate aldolase|nr:ribulose-5-phosphate 4-epimerase-like epimerase or aldolase [Brevibacillus sp.]
MEKTNVFVTQRTFTTVQEERQYRKEVLTAGFRIFGRFGFSNGNAGHISARDPQYKDCFWVNPLGVHFSDITVSDLVLVNNKNEIVEGKHDRINIAAFAIHNEVHEARPDVVAAAHSHSRYGMAWSTLGKLLQPSTQNDCAFYEDHALFNDFRGVVKDNSEGKRIAEALGEKKAIILKNHGIMTVGQSVESAVWWFIQMEEACQIQMLAAAAGTIQPIPHDQAEITRNQIGREAVGHNSFYTIWNRLSKLEPALD